MLSFVVSFDIINGKLSYLSSCHYQRNYFSYNNIINTTLIAPMDLCQSNADLSDTDRILPNEREHSEAGELVFGNFSTPQNILNSQIGKESEGIKQTSSTWSVSTFSEKTTTPDRQNQEASIPSTIQKELPLPPVPLVPPLPSSLQKAEQKLLGHLSRMMKCDKYIRMVTSIIKTFRSYRPKNRFVKMYKQLVIFRQVIRWESKYETILDLAHGDETLPLKLFSIFQLVGDFTDLASFWLTTIHQGTDRHQHLIDKLDQLQSDCYFIECCINLLSNAFTYLKYKCFTKSKQPKEEQKQNECGWRAIKYILDVVTSYNNSSLRKKMGKVNPKIAGYFTIISSAIGLFLMWR